MNQTFFFKILARLFSSDQSVKRIEFFVLLNNWSVKTSTSFDDIKMLLEKFDGEFDETWMSFNDLTVLAKEYDMKKF